MKYFGQICVLGSIFAMTGCAGLLGWNDGDGDVGNQPPPSSSSTMIAYDRYDGIWGIYLYNLSNGEITVLRDTADQEFFPAFSPDKSKVAFSSNKNGPFSIYVMDADGTNVVRLTAPDAADRNPGWSPDGSQIVFERSAGAQNIWIMDADGSNEVALTVGNATKRNPRFKPDGSVILYEVEGDGGSELFTMNPDGTGSTILTSGGLKNTTGSYSPDGSKIVWARSTDGSYTGYNIYVMNSDGTGIVQLTSTADAEGSPVFDASGNYIAFAGNQETAGVEGRSTVDSEIFLMSADGSNVVQLTFNTLGDTRPNFN